MTNPQITIGADLDNTLVCYDDPFHLAACEEKLIEPSLPRSKEKIRDAIRQLPDGERLWTRLQAIVYGPRMAEATLFDGALSFFRRCAATNIPVIIISHKTRFAMLDGHQVDLRKSALAWLEAKGFWSILSPDEVIFESTRAEKLERIRAMRCTHFIDDLVEVFEEPSFPSETEKILFAPHGRARHSVRAGLSNSESGAQGTAAPYHRAFSTWRDIENFFFNEQQR